MSHATFFPRSVLASVVLALAALLAAVSPGDTTPNAPVNPPPTPPEDGPGPEPEPTTGDPVGYISGKVYDTAVDIRVPCPDIDLVFKRVYERSMMSGSTLGPHWSHMYEWRMYVSSRTGASSIYAYADPEVPGFSKPHRFAAVDMGQKVYDLAGYSLEKIAEGCYRFTSPAGTMYMFNEAGVLVSSMSRNGTSIVFERETSTGAVVRAIHSNGRALGFSYRDDGRLSRITTPDPTVWIDFDYTNVVLVPIEGSEPIAVDAGYHYLSAVMRHEEKRVVTNRYEYSFVPVAGQRVPYVVCSWQAPRFPSGVPVPRSSWEYYILTNGIRFAGHVLAAKVDADGLGTVYGYIRDSDGFATCAYSSMDGGVLETSLEFLSQRTELGIEERRETIERRPYAGGITETQLRYDKLGRETSRTCGNETWARLYDHDGNLARRSVSGATPQGTFSFVTDYGYDTARRVTSIRRTFGKRNRFGKVEETDFTWGFSWDERRDTPQRIVTPEGRVREWTVDRHDIIVHGAGTNDARLVTRMLCTTNDRPFAVELPDGGRADLAYDVAGYLYVVTASDQPAVSFTRDSFGHVASISRPGPESVRTTSYVRNVHGRPLSVVHPDGTSESFVYNGSGTKIVAHGDALGRTDIYRWILGQPVHAGRVVNGMTNLLWSVAHDQQLNVVSLTDPLGRAAESYVLDENERVTAVTNLEKRVLTRNYLVSDLVASEKRFDGTTVSYDYDACANLASAIYPDDTLRFTWDGDGLLTSASNMVGTVSNVYDVVTGWLDISRGTDGRSVSYIRSNGGVVTSVTSVAGTTAYALDRAARRTRIESSTGTLSLGYCPWNGRVSAVTNVGGGVATYVYDVRDRVTNISWTVNGTPLGGFEYAYDAVGHIVARRHMLGTNHFDRTYAYDDLDRLVADETTLYTYDVAGNRTAKRGETEGDVVYVRGIGNRLSSWTGGSYRYNVAGNVRRITRNERPEFNLTWNGQYQLVKVSTNGVLVESYAYDALGRRTSTTTLEGTVHHIYDNNWQVIADLDSNGNVLCSYVWGEGPDNLLAVKVGTRSYAALTDIQGTVWGLVDGTNIVARWTYDAWGKVLSEEIAPSMPELAAFRYRFQGREFSVATGLVNFRMRWYDPETGRWLSKDPIRLGGGLNLYAFCCGDPLGGRDPLGLARLGVRGLNGSSTALTLGLTGVLIPITGPLILSDLGLFHEHIFFEDGKTPANIGFFKEGICEDKDKYLDNYHFFGPHYNDDKMRRAYEKVRDSGKWKPEGSGDGGYNLRNHNCHGFVNAVMREYGNL